MIAAWLMIAALQAPPAPQPVFEPYEGTLAEGLDEVRALSDAKKVDEAYVLCGRLLAPTRFDAWRERKLAEAGVMKRVVAVATPAFDWLGVSGLSPEERAAVNYAEGVVASNAGDRAHAEPVFQAARGLAGPGDLRLATIYNLGVNALLDGEQQRAKIPEIQGGQAAPRAAPPAAAPGAPPPPDPVELARASYLRAKEHFVERLRAQWDDADTRANVELVQRRLKELDEIQKKREQEKQEQEQKDQEEKDQQEKPENQKKDDQQQNEQQQDEQKQDDQQKPDPKSEEKSEEEKKDQEQPPPPEEKPQEEKPEEQEPKPAEEQIEKLLTKEEMMRLLDVLKQHEEEYEKLKAQMRQARRAKVKKDW